MLRLASLVAVLSSAGCEGGKGGMFPDGGGSGRACGGFTGELCSSDEFCDFPRNTCGFSDEQGTCRPRPQGCNDIFAPVCGCDGVVHSNDCDANAAGVDVDANGSCPVPAGQFACGFRACDRSSEYCERQTSDVGGEPDSFACKPFPGNCGGGTPSCACLTQEPCGSICDGTVLTGLELTCPGG